MALKGNTAFNITVILISAIFSILPITGCKEDGPVTFAVNGVSVDRPAITLTEGDSLKIYASVSPAWRPNWTILSSSPTF